MSHPGALKQLRINYGVAGLPLLFGDRQSWSVAHNVLLPPIKTHASLNADRSGEFRQNGTARCKKARYNQN